MIYLDHAASTPVDPRVLAAMVPYFSVSFSNPSSVHAGGREARAAIDQSRSIVAQVLGCQAHDLIFTSGATESNNLVIRACLEGWEKHAPGQVPHVVTSAIEHPAVLRTLQERQYLDDTELTVLAVDSDGLVDPGDVAAAIKPNTCLVSIMYVNNEIGVVQPIREIADLVSSHDVPFHTDAVQAPGFFSLDVDELGADLLTLSAHKFHGPKGVGILYARSGLDLVWQQRGGGQEFGRRAGTENVPGIVGLAAALQIADSERPTRAAYVGSLRDQLVEGILENVPEARLNGHPLRRSPSNANIQFPDIDGEAVLMELDMHGIAVSSGSACSSGAGEPSHVLTAIGLNADQAQASLRLTLGKDNTPEEIERTVGIVASSVERVRRVRSNRLVVID
jgi:cysteine desulfurase